MFLNEESNSVGLITGFVRAREVKRLLAETHPEQAHAQCDMYALWRLNERKPPTAANGSQPGGA